MTLGETVIMKKIIGIRKPLPIKDQITICITDALTKANRYLEPFPCLGSDGKLCCVIVKCKRHSYDKVMQLNVQYNAQGEIISVGESIPVAVSKGKINHQYIFNELIKIIPPPDPA